MRPYNELMLHEIKRELAFIWAAHRIHKLDGKMRLFSPRHQDHFVVAEQGYEVWFGPTEIDLVVKKIEVIYKDGVKPNTPLLLDPVVYRKLAGAKPIPLGSGVLWATGLVQGGKGEVNPLAISRLKKLGVFVDTYHCGDNEKAGIKALAFLEEAAMPASKDFTPEGSVVPGVQQLCDIMDIDSENPLGRYYLLSDLVYELPDGTVYQNPEFQDIFEGTSMKSIKDLANNRIHQQHILDAAKCWNAYGRAQPIYDRYGNDVANLERNLKSKSDSDRMVGLVRHELELLWAANKRAGLDGEMRLYSSPVQDCWRSKQPGQEIWFRDTEEDYAEAARRIQVLYNAGVLPNTPLLLDPVVYKRDEKGLPVPYGTAIVWGNCMCVGKQVLEPAMLERLKDLGMLTGKIIRAGEDESGLKAMGFLEQPFLFGEEDINEYKRLQLNEAAKDVMRARVEKERILMREQGYSEEREKQFAEKERQMMATVPETVVVEVLPIPGCREVFEISGANGEDYWQYLLTTGLEYLCTNGAFANPSMETPVPKTVEERAAFLAQYTVNLQHVLDAGNCWRSYDKLHPLWKRFGIDTENLEKNLKYFNLCGRNLNFLNMTGESREEGQTERFEFLVPGWLPKASITLLAGAGGLGRSTLVHKLALITSSDYKETDPNPIWLGSEIAKESCQGLTVYLAGEDSPGIVTARSEIMDPEGHSKRVMLKCGADFGANSDNTARDIQDFITDMQALPKVDLLVVDPARKYIAKDGENPEDVSKFFDVLEKFAVAKNCAVVVVHHLSREARPKTARDVLDMMQGSQMFVDRSRVIIGMVREGEKTVMGLAKNSIPPKMGMVEGERLFVRDPERLDLVWLPGEEGVRHFDVSAAELEKIRAKVGKV